MAKLVHNVQKKQHRERSQPLERKKFGFLEKKKDYQLRARDYHKKQNALKVLKQKAALANPDEYYHAMTAKKTDSNGILVSERDEEVLSVGQVKLLKTQDANYIKTLRNEELKKIDKLKKNLVFKSRGNHTIFVDSEQAKKEFNAAEFFQTDENLVNKRENRLRLDQLQSGTSIVEQLDESKLPKESLDKKRLKKFAILQAHLKRQNELKEVEERIDIQREGMKNGEKKKIVDTLGRTSFKFKRQRKR